MKKILRTVLLKKEFDPLLRVNEKIYEQLAPYLQVKQYSKGEIIKKPGEIEHYARYVYRGHIAKMIPSEKGRDYRVRIFGPGKIASDLASYFNNEKSDFYIKALSYVSAFELHDEAEKMLLKKIPEVAELASYINRQILMDAVLWHEAFNLPRETALKKMRKHFPHEMNHFSNKDLGYMLKCSVSTISKIKSSMDEVYPAL